MSHSNAKKSPWLRRGSRAPQVSPCLLGACHILPLLKKELMNHKPDTTCLDNPGPGRKLLATRSRALIEPDPNGHQHTAGIHGKVGVPVPVVADHPESIHGGGYHPDSHEGAGNRNARGGSKSPNLVRCPLCSAAQEDAGLLGTHDKVISRLNCRMVRQGPRDLLPATEGLRREKSNPKCQEPARARFTDRRPLSGRTRWRFLGRSALRPGHPWGRRRGQVPDDPRLQC